MVRQRLHLHRNANQFEPDLLNNDQRKIGGVIYREFFFFNQFEPVLLNDDQQKIGGVLYREFFFKETNFTKSLFQ